MTAVLAGNYIDPSGTTDVSKVLYLSLTYTIWTKPVFISGFGLVPLLSVKGNLHDKGHHMIYKTNVQLSGCYTMEFSIFI